MQEKLAQTKLRDYTCGELTAKNVDETVKLCGWVDVRRDHGGLIFVDLRDRWGVTQLVFNPDESRELHAVAEKLRLEYVISAKGKVRHRPEGTVNPKLETGEVEVVATEIEILNVSPTPPFEVNEIKSVSEDLRLQYRFLDLRRRNMLENMQLRYKITRTVRDYFDRKNFLEIETPFLTKSTPEGARDYLVPSRLVPGEFYALPQSPQLFKQILMVAGFDRYYQLVRCFRDEDLRADRQPEHTQIDLEMSFVAEEDIRGIIEGFMSEVFEKVMGRKLETPLPKISYTDAMDTYGSDKPDLRYEMKLVDATEELKGSDFKIFEETLKKGGVIKGLRVEGEAGLSRKDVDDLTAYIKDFGAKGLAWFKVREGLKVESPIAKFFGEDKQHAVVAKFGAKEDDIIFFVADQWYVTTSSLGALREHFAKKKKLIPRDVFKLCWVVDFPLLEYSEEEGRFVALHHPFTSPKEEDIPLLNEEPRAARARAYDLVMNGTEIGGGSIRIHSKELQEKMFGILGISKEDAEKKFGFLLRALKFGAPPHGGIALGLDRLTAVLLGLDSIRDVIAFPKTQKATCPLTGAPSTVSEKQLKELHLQVKGGKK